MCALARSRRNGTPASTQLEGDALCSSAHPGLSGVAETLLIPLYVRALESARPDALIRDPRAVELVASRAADFARIRHIHMDEGDRAALVLRNRELDRVARDFLARHDDAVVVHIGCGLDARFERVDDGRAEWYDLDLPEVIELRRSVIGGESSRYHHLATSAFESGWMESLSPHGNRPFLFMAEGVFMYFEEERIKWLVRELRSRFPGAELAFDAFSPFLVRANNLRLRLSRSKLTARYHWGLAAGRDLEAWASGIRLLEEWFPFDRPEPRLARMRWVRHVPLLAKVMGIYRYRLGNGAHSPSPGPRPDPGAGTGAGS